MKHCKCLKRAVLAQIENQTRPFNIYSTMFPLSRRYLLPSLHLPIHGVHMIGLLTSGNGLRPKINEKKRIKLFGKTAPFTRYLQFFIIQIS